MVTGPRAGTDTNLLVVTGRIGRCEHDRVALELSKNKKPLVRFKLAVSQDAPFPAMWFNVQGRGRTAEIIVEDLRLGTGDYVTIVGGIGSAKIQESDSRFFYIHVRQIFLNARARRRTDPDLLDDPTAGVQGSVGPAEDPDERLPIL